MANIVIKELLSSDKVSEIVDKINFNFDQLLLNGGGPIGLTGGPGERGQIGPRGSSWFTINDLWTTADSPTWSGTPVKVNNILLPGFPQYKGDPNRFRPVAPTGVSPSLPWIFPESTFTFSIPTKTVRGGDLYLQESDDTFNSTSSKDGDIWEYNGLSLTWSQTGVNIKGTAGAGGANAISDWVRESLGSTDIIYPKTISGQDITRVLIGQDSNIFNLDNSQAALTINTENTHLAFNHPDLHSELVNPGDEDKGGTISMSSNGDFLIIGSSVSGASNQIVIQSLDTDITIQSNGVNFTTYRQSPSNSVHFFEGGAIQVNHPSSTSLHYAKYIAPVGPTTDHIFNQQFETSEGRIHLYTSFNGATTAPHIILQGQNTSNVGIGQFTSGTNPLSKLGIKGNLAVGNNYGQLSAPGNGAIIEGNVGIGTPIPLVTLQVHGEIVISRANSYLGDNVIWTGTGFGPIYNGAGWFFKQVPTTVDANAELQLVLTSVTTPGNNSPQNSVISIKQATGTSHGKVGINISGFATHSRLTVNDTDGSGIQLLRYQTLVPGSSDFFGSTSGARIYHSASSDVNIDRRFNIYQLETNDFVIGNKTLAYPTNALHHRIVIKKESGFIGINTLRPKHTFTLKGRDYISEPDLSSPAPVGGFDPDEINMGTFEDVAINGLNINTAPSHTETNIQGASYIGFNAWFSNPGASGSNPEVIYGDIEGQTGSAGAIIFADRNGNLHFANFEQ